MKGPQVLSGTPPALPTTTPSGTALAELDPHSDLKGRKILIVDDEPLNRRILRTILQSAEFTVIEADSGKAALARYSESTPDLVMLDVMMPELSGFDTCRELKRVYGGACAPVIFITAKTEPEDVIEGLNAGGVDYLPKPVRAKEAIARVRVHVQNRLLTEDLTRANAAKNRFLGMAAHDLRNPLASIRGLSEFLKEGAVGPLTPEQLDLIDTIHTSSCTMIEMVNELLDVATIESGGFKLTLSPQHLAALMLPSVNQMKIEAAKKRTEIRFNADAQPPALLVDGNKLRQVVDNLLSNAIKYSPPGSIVSIFTFVDQAQGTGGFGVQDMGPGISADDRAKLFKDFSRLSAQPTAGEKSTGLGLAICRNIVHALKGSITVTNLPDKGCEFRVSLPLPP